MKTLIIMLVMIGTAYGQTKSLKNKILKGSEVGATTIMVASGATLFGAGVLGSNSAVPLVYHPKNEGTYNGKQISKVMKRLEKGKTMHQMVGPEGLHVKELRSTNDLMHALKNSETVRVVIPGHRSLQHARYEKSACIAKYATPIFLVSSVMEILLYANRVSTASKKEINRFETQR